MMNDHTRAIEIAYSKSWTFGGDPPLDRYLLCEEITRAMNEAFAAGQTARRDKSDEALARAIKGLGAIAEPLGALQAKAEADGEKLSSQAFEIANDPAYLKQVARLTLSAINEAA